MPFRFETCCRISHRPFAGWLVVAFSCVLIQNASAFQVTSSEKAVADLDQVKSVVDKALPFGELEKRFAQEHQVTNVFRPTMRLPTTAPQQRQDELSAEAVRRTIQFGVEFLKNKQRENGSWADIPRYDGGVTALVTLALLNAGEKPESKRIKAAMNHLKTIRRENTYVVALRVMAMAAADPQAKTYATTITQDINWLLQHQLPNGGWSYTGDAGGFRQGDASNSQFAILALHEATSVGLKIPLDNWERADAYWKSLRMGDGGFGYNPRSGRSSGSMTCAGIASTIIIREHLLDADQAINGERANCCNADDDDVIEDAMQWLADRYTVRTNPSGRRQSEPIKHLYYLYALERAGRFSGRRFIGNNDWYRDGAKLLLEKVLPSGAWQGRNSSVQEHNQLIASSYCLLFLSKGKRPVAVGKFNHGAADWDLHPQGVHYLTRRLEKEWKQKLNWQTVKADGSTVDDLFEAPVLFMSGQDVIGLDGAQKATLKKYIENGGFLLAEACRGEGCDDGSYDQAFRQLMADLFPDSELQTIDPSHPIWVSHFKILPSNERPLLGLQACCRTSVVYCPANLSCYWSLGKPSVMENNRVPLALQNRVEYASQLGVNVIAYATGRELREKFDTPKLVEDAAKMLSERALIFPKLQHGGGSDDAPNAWKKVLEEVKVGIGLEIKTAKKMISASPESLIDHPFIFVHGRNRIEFTPDERDALRRYLELGGFIFADSICASDAFSNSFREEMKTILGAPLAPIPKDHDIWLNVRYGNRLDRVTLRTKDAAAPGGFRETVTAPQMEGVELNGRLAVVFSPFDLSCALENTALSNCTGYTRADALQIGAKVILYSLRSDAVR